LTIAGFEIEKKFSIGHLITIVTVIISMTIGWQALAGQSTDNAKSIIQVQIANDRQDQALATMLATINADRLENQKLLTEMRVDIRYLRRSEETAKRLAAEDDLE
jgi:hypothetical protein